MKTYHQFTLIAAAVAAIASAASSTLAVPVWAMFIGWVAFFSRGVNARAGLVNLVCVLLGLTFGAGAVFALGALGPYLGGFALPLVVFVIATGVVSLRAVPGVNNVLGIFLGLIAWFAIHQTPSLEALLELGLAAAIGSVAGWISHALQKNLIPVI